MNDMLWDISCSSFCCTFRGSIESMQRWVKQRLGSATVKLDLRQVEDAETAARQLHEWVRWQAKEFGHDPDIEVVLLTPEKGEELGYGRVWRVMWEAGPFEWAVSLTLGCNMYSGETGNYANEDAQVLLLGNKHWFAEPYFSFDIGIIPD